jgi:hypothetical protein
MIPMGHAVRMGEMKNRYKILVGKREMKRPLGMHRSGWEDNIKINLETECEDID